MPYLLALVLTVLIELPVWVVLLRVRLALASGPAAVVAVAVNVVSHPLLWFVLVPASETATGSTVLAVTLSEATVVIGEAVLAAVLVAVVARRPGPPIAATLVIAVLANALSWAVGALLALAY